MEKNQPYFDPYNFNMQLGNNQHMQGMQELPVGIDPMAVNPAMYYEQQYMYYKYLTQMLDYKIKLREFEQSNRDKK